MDKMIYLNNLFDLYQELFTEKQRMYFKDYYFFNLSYGEISDKYGISRNAIFKQLKNISNKLEDYEKKLKLFAKKREIDDIIKLIDNKRIKEALGRVY